VGQDV